ncbi:MAG: hypothetical protein ABEI52_03725, partial [Halobacteriaceae archaeon]
PLFGSPMAYVTTFTIVALIWMLALQSRFDTERAVALSGLIAIAPPLSGAVGYGMENQSITLVAPLLGAIFALVATVLVWALIHDRVTSVFASNLVIFGHALDG